MIDIMLDLETMGNKTKPAIAQISAVAFNIETCETFEEFDRHVHLQSSIDAGLDVTASTAIFWLDQSKEARELLIKGQEKADQLVTVLVDFADFINTLRSHYGDIRVWGNGSMADNRWLESAYEACKMESPINFWEHSDLRTMVDYGWRKQKTDYKQSQEFEGVKHNAIDDCKHQIKYLVNIWNH